MHERMKEEVEEKEKEKTRKKTKKAVHDWQEEKKREMAVVVMVV